MNAKFETILELANCRGCIFMTQVSGDTTMYCTKFAEGDPKTFPPVDEVKNCDVKNSNLVHQLKMHQPKLGLGFVMRPLGGEEEGDAEVILVGATGVLHRAKLSKLFPAETFVVLPSVRVFDERGVDHTDLILKKALQKAYEEVPQSSLVFQGLLDEESS